MNNKWMSIAAVLIVIALAGATSEESEEGRLRTTSVWRESGYQVT